MFENAIELGPQFARSHRADADQIAAITADAFRRDPFNTWLFGNFAAMHMAFRALARHQYTERGFSYRLGDEGAAMWMMPGGNSAFPIRALPSFLWAGLTKASRGGIGRLLKTANAMEGNHPAYEHAYLFTIGVRGSAQGKGLGRKLIQPVLDACDQQKIPAYLENSNPENCGFYRSCGFERITMIHPLPQSPPLEAMVRKPR